MKKNILKSEGMQSFIASLICIVVGFLVGYITLLFIDPANAGGAIIAVLKNFFNYNKGSLILKNLGNTLVKTAPLLLCALAVLFSYKVGLFNIGTSGQYCAGICACLYAALKWQWSWIACVLFAILAGAVVASLVGLLKAYCNVNEVISGIMFNWIILYLTNTILSSVKEPTSPYTLRIASYGVKAKLPSLGLDKLLNNNQYVTIAIPLSVIVAILVWIILDKTKFGYELKATGLNRNAAKYCGMAEKRNLIISLVISGALAGLGASMYYLTGFSQWEVSATSVPAMGFNGIAATFLGGLNPIGTIFASYFIQHITSGGAYVDLSIFCAQTSDLISSVIIYLCGFVFFIKTVLKKWTKSEIEKKR